jgi:hypothetical protein
VGRLNRTGAAGVTGECSRLQLLLDLFDGRGIDNTYAGLVSLAPSLNIPATVLSTGCGIDDVL